MSTDSKGKNIPTFKRIRQWTWPSDLQFAQHSLVWVGRCHAQTFYWGNYCKILIAFNSQPEGQFELKIHLCSKQMQIHPSEEDIAFLRSEHAKVVNANGIPVRLKIWDTAGQEKFRSLTKSYYRDSDGWLCHLHPHYLLFPAVVLVYDISRMETLVHTKYNRSSRKIYRSWMDEITANADSKTLLLLAGNKADELRERAVSKRDGERVA
ncbi:Ras family protein, partial [Opisthorchis viverrini]